LARYLKKVWLSVIILSSALEPQNGIWSPDGFARGGTGWAMAGVATLSSLARPQRYSQVKLKDQA
jgi:hypothetical protein